MNTTHGSASKHVVGQWIAVGLVVGYYRRENYKTDCEFVHKDSKLQSERKNVELSQPILDLTPVGVRVFWLPLYSTPVGAKILDAKTPATDYSARKEKTQKEYVPEDPDADPNPSDSLSSESDLADNINYKCRRSDKKSIRNGRNRTLSNCVQS